MSLPTIPRECSDLLYIGQILEILPVSRSTWARWVSAGIVSRGVKLGSRPAWPRDEISRLIACGTQVAEASNEASEAA